MRPGPRHPAIGRPVSSRLGYDGFQRAAYPTWTPNLVGATQPQPMTFQCTNGGWVDSVYSTESFNVPVQVTFSYTADHAVLVGFDNNPTAGPSYDTMEAHGGNIGGLDYSYFEAGGYVASWGGIAIGDRLQLVYTPATGVTEGFRIGSNGIRTSVGTNSVATGLTVKLKMVFGYVGHRVQILSFGAL